MSIRFSPVRDVTAKQSATGGGMNLLRLAMCGHKTSTTGSLMRGNMVMLCPACWAKRKEKA